MSPLDRLTFDAQGLIPAVVQDWRDGSVLMVAYMNREALERTQAKQTVHFWSRSRQRLWEKGETSGHYLRVKELFVDCDRDAILVKAEPVGPTCHTGAPSCFFRPIDRIDDDTAGTAPSAASVSSGGVLERIAETIQARKASPQANSYVSKLLQGGTDRILKKVVEEAGEVVLAAKNRNRTEIVYETADLLFHTLVALGEQEIPLHEVYTELARRHGTSGIRPGEEGKPA
ncbi:MAG: bifunctional phosphoribosyl-AMP cyclohydrolase/phosphoribosyl-ATP diphosphatase HisIE [Nitrospiraceae bacterium]